MNPIRMLLDYRACPGLSQEETGLSPVFTLYDSSDALTLDALKLYANRARAAESYIVMDQEANVSLSEGGAPAGTIPFLSTVILNPDTTKQALGNPERWLPNPNIAAEKVYWHSWITRILAADPHAHFGFFGSPGPFAPGYNPISEDIDMTFYETTFKADCALNASIFAPFVTHVFPAFYPAHPSGFSNDVMAGIAFALQLQRMYYPRAKIVPYLAQRYSVPWETTVFNKYCGDNYVRALFQALSSVPEIQEVVFFPLGANNGDGTPNAIATQEARQFIAAAQPYLRGY